MPKDVAGEKATWRKAFDAAEGAVAPRVEALVKTGGFAEVVSLAARARREAQSAVESRSRWLWHLVNLPAATDVARLRRNLAALDHDVRRLSLELERERHRADRPEENDDAEPAGAGAPRRRAQRAARPQRDQARRGNRSA